MSEDWMFDLPASVRQLPLGRLILPATHQSAAFKIDYQAIRKHNLYKIGRKLKERAERKCITQQFSIFDQLKFGIRHFDFELFKRKNNKLYFGHEAYPCIPALETLIQITTYLSLHRGEVVVVRIKPSIQCDDYLDIQTFLMNVEITLNYVLVPNNLPALEMSLQELCDANKRLLISCERHYAMTDYIWTYRVRKTNWITLRDDRRNISLHDLEDEQGWRILSLFVSEFDKLEDNAKELNREIQLQFMDNMAILPNVNLREFDAIEVDFPDPLLVSWIISLNEGLTE